MAKTGKGTKKKNRCYELTWTGARYQMIIGLIDSKLKMIFNRDPSGLITSMSGPLNNKQLGVTYNNDLEITAVNHTLPQAFTEAYTYDSRGNRLTSHLNSFTYDGLNRLTDSATHSFTYDADGNLTRERHKVTGETKNYYYNAANRLIKYEHYRSDAAPADITATYTYDLYGRRIAKTVNGTTTRFLWDGDNISAEFDQNLQPLRHYVYGVGIDDIEGQYDHTQGGANPFSTDLSGWHSYTKDQVGTITHVISHRDQHTTPITLDTFGNPVAGPGPDSPFNTTGSRSTPTSFGFQSKWYCQ